MHILRHKKARMAEAIRAFLIINRDKRIIRRNYRTLISTSKSLIFKEKPTTLM